MSSFIANTTTIKNNITVLKKRQAYYSSKIKTFSDLSNFGASSNVTVKLYLSKLRNSYQALSNNLEHLISYLEDYVSDIEAIEYKASNIEGYACIAEEVKHTVETIRNSMKNLEIENTTMFDITNVNLENTNSTVDSFSMSNDSTSTNSNSSFSSSVDSVEKKGFGSIMKSALVFGLTGTTTLAEKQEYLSNVISSAIAGNKERRTSIATSAFEKYSSYQSWRSNMSNSAISFAKETYKKAAEKVKKAMSPVTNYINGKASIPELIIEDSAYTQTYQAYLEPIEEELKKISETQKLIENEYSKYAEIEKYRDQITKFEKYGLMSSWEAEAILSNKMPKKFQEKILKDFKTIEDYENYITQLKDLLSSCDVATAQASNLKEVGKYECLSVLEDFQKFEYNTKVNTKDLNMISDNGVMRYSTYEEYCKKNGNVSELAYAEALGKAIDSLRSSGAVEGIEISNHTQQLINLAKVSSKDSDYAKYYNYLYKTYGKDAANEYLSVMEPTVNNILGREQAEKILSHLTTSEGTTCAIKNHLNTTEMGLGAGGASFVSGIEYALSGVKAFFTNEAPTRANSVEEYANMYVQNALQSGEYTGKFLKDNYVVSQGIGNMAPSIALSAMGVPVAGSIALGVSSGGNSYHSAMVDGYSNTQALSYGIISGFTEALTEKYLGGLPGLSDVEVTGLKTFVKAMIKEGNEEAVQEAFDSLVRKGIFKENINGEELLANMGESWKYGAITAGILQTPSAIFNSINVKNNQNLNTETIVSETLNAQLDEIKKSTEENTQNINIEQNSTNELIKKINVDNMEGFSKDANGLIHLEVTDELYKTIYEEKNKRNQFSLNSKDGVNDLVLIHSTSYPPYDGIIKNNYEGNKKFTKYFSFGDLNLKADYISQRITTHFTLNGKVGNNDGGSWDNANIIAIDPLKNQINNMKNIYSGDSWSIGNLELSKDAILLIPEIEASKYNLDDFGRSIIFYKGDPQKALNVLLADLGFKPQNITGWAWEKNEGFSTKAILQDGQTNSQHRSSLEQSLEILLNRRNSTLALMRPNVNIDNLDLNISTQELRTLYELFYVDSNNGAPTIGNVNSIENLESYAPEIKKAIDQSSDSKIMNFLISYGVTLDGENIKLLNPYEMYEYISSNEIKETDIQKLKEILQITDNLSNNENLQIDLNSSISSIVNYASLEKLKVLNKEFQEITNTINELLPELIWGQDGLELKGYIPSSQENLLKNILDGEDTIKKIGEGTNSFLEFHKKISEGNISIEGAKKLLIEKVKQIQSVFGIKQDISLSNEATSKVEEKILNDISDSSISITENNALGVQEDTTLKSAIENTPGINILRPDKKVIVSSSALEKIKYFIKKDNVYYPLLYDKLTNEMPLRTFNEAMERIIFEGKIIAKHIPSEKNDIQYNTDLISSLSEKYNELLLKEKGISYLKMSDASISELLNIIYQMDNEIANYYLTRDLIVAKSDISENLKYFASDIEIQQFNEEYEKAIQNKDLKKMKAMLNNVQDAILKEWKNYLQNINSMDNDHFAFIGHTTPFTKFEGEFSTRYVSGSLFTQDLTDTYKTGYGFILAPKEIVGASSQDMHIKNDALDESSLRSASVLKKIDHPQRIIDECLKLKEENANKGLVRSVYNEVVIDGFEPIGIFCFTNKDSNTNYEYALQLQESFPNLDIYNFDVTKSLNHWYLKKISQNVKLKDCKTILDVTDQLFELRKYKEENSFKISIENLFPNITINELEDLRFTASTLLYEIGKNPVENVTFENVGSILIENLKTVFQKCENFDDVYKTMNTIDVPYSKKFFDNFEEFKDAINVIHNDYNLQDIFDENIKDHIHSYQDLFDYTLETVKKNDNFDSMQDLDKLTESPAIRVLDLYNPNIDMTRRKEIIKSEVEIFDLEKFYLQQMKNEGAVLLITPEQSVMTESFGDYGLFGEFGQHSPTVNEIYKVIYNDEKIDFNKLSENSWEEKVMKDGNICIQLVNGVSPSIVWIPETINQFQYDALKDFSNQVSNISEKYGIKPEFMPTFTDEFGFNGLQLSLDEAKKRIGTVDIRNEVIIDDKNKDFKSTQEIDLEKTLELEPIELLEDTLEYDSSLPNAIYVGLNSDATAQLVNTKILEDILNDEEVYDKFIHYKENKFDFEKPKGIYIKALEEYLKIKEENGSVTSIEKSRLKTILEKENSNLKEFVSSYLADKISSGEEPIETFQMIRGILFDKNGYETFGTMPNTMSKINTYVSLDSLKNEIYAHNLWVPKELDTIFEKCHHDFISLVNKGDTYFKEFNTYGIDQGSIQKVLRSDLEKTKELIKKVQKYRPELNEKEAYKFLRGIDVNGVCDYAAVLNELVYLLRNHSELVEKHFGYPMYEEKNGIKTWKAAELLTDFYTFWNQNNKFIFEKKGIFKKLKIGTDENKFKISTSNFINDYAINKFLENFGIKMSKEIKHKEIIDTYDKIINKHQENVHFNVNDLKSQIAYKLMQGSFLNMGVFPLIDRPITFRNLLQGSNVSTSNWNEGKKNDRISGGHAIVITGLTDNGLIVSSWGGKYEILWSDLQNNAFRIDELDYE